ncbi:hypothetical protein DENIS_4868 [Desulfonema ishimotonii]|uniref:KilA-N DNA-binding domain-containing protein n=1 Tax=Desulfonema ishimotonii TaxID=45657 RepID=A0A401G3Q5_9BACT|nr:ORF6N domain-containing protein [Desulfonema ishimotonii]GBC63869.1 hypothetical protein DENIS_4868 [Desulfonema ishimotonii]
MNHQAIEISGTEIPVIEYKDERVITFKNIDRVHQRPEGTARKRFNDNKSRFIEDEDFFNVPYEEWTQLMTVRFSDGHKGGRKGKIKFITESGYLMLVKSFTDDLAWDVQRWLVKGYFRAKAYEQIRSEFSESSSGLSGELFDRSVDRFEKALKAVTLMGISGRQEALLTANRITRETTGVDLADIIRPELKKSAPLRTESLPRIPSVTESELIRFAELWYAEYGSRSVLTRQLCELTEGTDIQIPPGRCETRFQKIKFGKMLSKLDGYQVGHYRITGAGKKRNLRLWRLKLADEK